MKQSMQLFYKRMSSFLSYKLKFTTQILLFLDKTHVSIKIKKIAFFLSYSLLFCFDDFCKFI